MTGMPAFDDDWSAAPPEGPPGPSAGTPEPLVPRDLDMARRTGGVSRFEEDE
jgi:hypothetical protein